MRDSYGTCFVCVCQCVTTLATSASACTCNQRYFLGCFLDFDLWIFEKPYSYGVKSQYANELELTTSHSRALLAPVKGSSFCEGQAVGRLLL